MKKKQGHAIITPFQNYISEREKFFAAHPKVKIIEEIKTLTLGAVKMEDINIPGFHMQAPQQVLMIMWAVVFEEEVKELISGNGNLNREEVAEEKSSLIITK